MKRNDERGSVNPFMIGMILFAVVAIGAGGAFFWAFTQMGHYRDNADQLIAEAVQEAKTDQQKQLQAQFAEDMKRPNLTFQGSSDFGSIRFDYPRTWSQFVASNGKNGLEVYFHPVAVPPLEKDVAFALRLVVDSKAYDAVLKSYNSKVKDGTLSASTLTIGRTETFSGYEGTRIDGQFSDNINGSVAIFKIRDKTMQLFVDSQDFMKDFDETILPSLTFEP